MYRVGVWCASSMIWRTAAALMLLVASVRGAEAQCPPLMAPNCDPSVNQDLYPSLFMVHGAYAGQVYTVGNVIMLVAKFPNNTCDLPDPTTLGPECSPQMIVSLFTENGTCFNISAASVKKVEDDFGFSFAEDPLLETESGIYNHWVFPLYIVGGMSTSRLEVKSLTIPIACNSERAIFQNTNQITQSAHVTPPVAVDTAPPEVVSIHTGKASGVYTNGTVINIVVELSKDVALSDLPGQFSSVYTDIQSNRIPYGIPYLPLNSNVFVPLLGYANTLSKKRISFLYRVGVGEETPHGKQLDVAPGSSIVLNGGSIVAYGTGLDLNLSTMPGPGQEGSLSHPTANKIYIMKSDEKFPPLQYDAGENPITLIDEVGSTRRHLKATRVSVNLELISAVLDQKTQAIKAEFTLHTSWSDNRLKNPKANSITEYTSNLIDTDQIWSPKLKFINSRDAVTIVETVVMVQNTGKVAIAERYTGKFGVDLDMRDFPFDTQSFIWHIRSQFDKSTVIFSTASREERFNASTALKSVSNPYFTFSDYFQSTRTVETGPYRGFDTLSIHLKATRVTSLHTIFLAFPLCLISVIVCLVLYQDPSKSSRLVVPGSAIMATIVFSFVVVNLAPPVGYPTRIHLLIFHTNVLSMFVLVVSSYLNTISLGRRKLVDMENESKKLLKDAYWLAKNVNPSPRKVVVMPGGVNKPVTSQASAEVSAEVPFPDVTKEFSLRARPGADMSFSSLLHSVSTVAITQDEVLLPPPAHESFVEGVDLLNSEEVQALKKMQWSGPVNIFWGSARITAANSESWATHVRFADEVLRMAVPIICLASLICILGAVGMDGFTGPVASPRSSVDFL